MNDHINLAAYGIVPNERGELLLIQRDDTRTWAPPGGSLNADELPTQGVVREVFEETGLQTLPVRLISLYHIPLPGQEYLTFGFRCLIRGGKLTPSSESPQLGFYNLRRPPGRILAMHQDRLKRGLTHNGLHPYWELSKPTLGFRLLHRFVSPMVYGWMDLRRKWQGQPAYHPPTPWQLAASAIIQDDKGHILWVRRADNRLWNLPGGRREPMESPWQTAIRETYEETGLHVRLTHLLGVYIRPGNRIRLTFKAEIVGGQLTHGPESVEFGYFAIGEEPTDVTQFHLQRVADFPQAMEQPIFRLDESKGA